MKHSFYGSVNETSASGSLCKDLNGIQQPLQSWRAICPPDTKGLRNYNRRWVMPHHSLIFHRKFTLNAKMNPLGRFRPSPVVQMLVRCGWSGSQNKKRNIVQCGDEMAYPLVFGTVLAVCAPSLCLETPQSTKRKKNPLYFVLNPL